jgi:hypothetical protein
MAEESQDVFQKFVSEAEHFLKFFPIAVGAIYLLGFLVVAIELAGYDASPLELVKIQYLAAGFWFSLVVILYCATVAIAQSFFSSKWQSRASANPRKQRHSRMLGSIVVGVVLLAANSMSSYQIRLYGWLFPRRVGHLADILGWQHSLLLVVLLLVFSDITAQIYFLLTDTAVRPEKRQFWKWLFIFISLFWFVFGIFSCIQAFSRDVYPRIPFSLGGGKTRQVIFWLGANTGAADSFLKRDKSNSGYTIPYELLVESENSLVVISPETGQQTIEFDRKSVGAMMVQGTRTGPANFQRNVNEGESSH